MKNQDKLTPHETSAAPGNIGAALEVRRGDRRRRIRGAVQDSIAPATRRAYQSDLCLFARWCEMHDEEPFPASHEVVADYVLRLEEYGHALATLERRLVTIGQAHVLQGLADPTKHPETRKVMRGIRRRNLLAPYRVNPLLPRDAALWLQELADSNRTVRDAALITMGLAGGFRRSELAALRLRDVTLVDEGIIVYIARSKTNQTGDGRDVGLRRGNQDITCPVKRWRAWLQLTGRLGNDLTERQLNDWAFWSVDPQDNLVEGQHIVGQTVARAVKRLARAGGAQASRYSGHSLRAGLVTASITAGVPVDRIMQQTGHKSYPMLQRYIRRADLWNQNPSGMIGL